jgi:hypothetical protein
MQSSFKCPTFSIRDVLRYDWRYGKRKGLGSVRVVKIKGGFEPGDFETMALCNYRN